MKVHRIVSMDGLLLGEMTVNDFYSEQKAGEFFQALVIKNARYREKMISSEDWPKYVEGYMNSDRPDDYDIEWRTYEQKLVVWALGMNTREGTVTNLYHTEERGKVSLRDFVHEWWSEALPEKDRPELAADIVDEDIEYYFEIHDHDSYNLEPLNVS